MRPRDPRRLLAGRRNALARVRILDMPDTADARAGSVTTHQSAEVTLPRTELERIWTPEYLERLARTYWRFLSRVSLGLLRVRYTPNSREVVLIGRPLVLLRFEPPEYDVGPGRGSVTWRIEGGLLVAPHGRGKGFLRLTVERPPESSGPEVTVRVTSEVESFNPLIAGWGWFSRIGRFIYKGTQMRIHVVVTHAFLRSLARLDLEPSIVGTLAPPEPGVSPASRR